MAVLTVFRRLQLYVKTVIPQSSSISHIETSKGMLYIMNTTAWGLSQWRAAKTRVDCWEKRTSRIHWTRQLLSLAQRCWDTIFLLISRLYSAVQGSKKRAVNRDLPDERYFEWDSRRCPWHHWAESQRKIAQLWVFISLKESYVQNGFGKRGEQKPPSGVSGQTGKWVLRWLQCSR